MRVKMYDCAFIKKFKKVQGPFCPQNIYFGKVMNRQSKVYLIPIN